LSGLSLASDLCSTRGVIIYFMSSYFKTFKREESKDIGLLLDPYSGPVNAPRFGHSVMACDVVVANMRACGKFRCCFVGNEAARYAEWSQLACTAVTIRLQTQKLKRLSWITKSGTLGNKHKFV